MSIYIIRCPSSPLEKGGPRRILKLRSEATPSFDIRNSICRVGKAASRQRVATKPLSEPYKRISHTYGSSVNLSDSLRSSEWIQVFADIRLRPFNPAKCLVKAVPCVRSPLAFTVKPFVQDPRHMVVIGCAHFRIIRHSVIAQMSLYAFLGSPEHCSLA